MQRSKSAFTLIELLVVIAIIAILAAILFPVFAQAKNAAKKTNDISGAKQLGLASMMYAADYDDTYVPAILNPSNGTEACWSPWYVWLNPYMKTIGPAVTPNWCGSLGEFNNVRRSFGFLRSAMASGEVNSWAANGYIMGFSFPAWGRPDDDPTLTMTAVARPSDVIMFTMGNSDSGNPFGNSVADMVRPDDLEDAFPTREQQAQWFQNNWVGRDFTNIDAGWGCPIGPYLCKGPSFRYNRTAPMVFADGSAKALNPGRVGLRQIFPDESIPFCVQGVNHAHDLHFGLARRFGFRTFRLWSQL